MDDYKDADRLQIAALVSSLENTLMLLEFWYKHAKPDWDGKATSGGVIATARALVAKTKEE